MIQQLDPSHIYAKETRETLPPSPPIAKSCPVPTLAHSLHLLQTAPAAAAHFPSVVRGCRSAGHLVFQRKIFFRKCKLFFLSVEAF